MPIDMYVHSTICAMLYSFMANPTSNAGRERIAKLPAIAATT